MIIGAVVINHASAASQLEQEELKNKILNDWEKRRSFSVIKYQLSGELNWFSDFGVTQADYHMTSNPWGLLSFIIIKSKLGTEVFNIKCN